MQVLWVLWGIGVLNVVALAVGMAVSSIRDRYGKVGLELLPTVLGLFAIVTTSVGCLSGVALILLSGVGVVLVVGTAVQLFGPGLLAVALLGQLWDSWRIRRPLLPRDEAVRLIQAGLVRSFKRRFRVVKLSFHPSAVKQFQVRSRRAHRKDYPAFVAAENARRTQGIHYVYVPKPHR